LTIPWVTSIRQPATPDDHPLIRKKGHKQVFSMNRPEVHDVLRRWRTLADGHDPRRVLVGETYVLDLDSLMPFYGQGEDELNLAFNFLFVHSDLDAGALSTVVEGVEQKLPRSAWPVYTGSNHDAGRLMTRWAGDDERRARVALMMLLTLRGTPFLYYGDELALAEVPLDPATALDPVARRTGDPSRNRDPCRTPMPWSAEPGGGFTTADATPWLPFGDLAACNVAAQREDPGSVLHFVRDLIALRRRRSELSTGSYEALPAPAGAWAWRRGERFAVALNLSDAEAAVEGVGGRVAMATDRAREGEEIDGTVRLGAHEGVVIELAS
jgi:alpha-glucosidase